MIVLDSSFLVSFYLSSDSNHDKALELANTNTNEEMILSDIILFETLTVLNYKEGIELAKECYDELTNNRQIKIFSITETEKQEILQYFFKQKTKISLADAGVIYYATKTRSKILGFDQMISKLCKTGLA